MHLETWQWVAWQVLKYARKAGNIKLGIAGIAIRTTDKCRLNFLAAES